MGIKVKFLDNWLDSIKEKSPVAAEIVKQFIDQTLHILMAIASVWVLGYPISLLKAPVWVSATVSGVLTAAWMAFREYTQWPSNRVWDPILDWSFQAIGLGLGLWSLISFIN